MVEERIEVLRNGHITDLCQMVLTKLYLDLHSPEALRLMETCHFMSKIGSLMRAMAIFACTRPCCIKRSKLIPLSKWVEVWVMCASVVKAEGWPASAWLNSCGATYMGPTLKTSIKDLGTYRGNVIDIDVGSEDPGDVNVNPALVQLHAELQGGWYLLARSHHDGFGESCLYLVLSSGRCAWLACDTSNPWRELGVIILGEHLHSVWSKCKEINDEVGRYENQRLQLSQRVTLCFCVIQNTMYEMRHPKLTSFLTTLLGKPLDRLMEILDRGLYEPAPRMVDPSPHEWALDTAVHKEESVLQEVDHQGETAAERDHELLQMQAEQEWADNVERLIHLGSSSSDRDSQESEQIFLYPYSRCPKEFMNALLYGPELQSVREAMMAHDCSFILDGGAKIFVWPEQYQMVLSELSNQNISVLASHVIVAESLLPQLEASIETIPSLKNVRVKKNDIAVVANAPKRQQDPIRQEVQQHGKRQGAEDWMHVLSVERTFICSVRVLLAHQSVNQSTAEVHGVRNQRRIQI